MPGMLTGGVMPRVLDEVPAHGHHVALGVPVLEYAERKPDGQMSGSAMEKQQGTTYSDQKVASHSGWSTFILTTGGTTTGGAFLGGAFGGPAGAIGGTIVGIVLGLLLHRSKQ